MNKILVFHLFLGDDYKINPSLDIHKTCLKMYANVFDEMRFTITAKDLNDKEKIKWGMDWILDISGDKPVKISIRKNHPLYETKTFKDEILDNIDTMRDYVFFAHSKGAVRMDGKETYTKSNPESVCRWIVGMYYFSLNFMDEVIDRFSGHIRASEIFYGPFLTMYKDPKVSPMLRYNKHNCFYQGTFFWINMAKLSNYLKQGLLKMPEIDDRYWTEMLPGVLCGRELYGDGLASHKDAAINDDFNLYVLKREGWELLSRIFGEPDFMKISDEIYDLVAGKPTISMVG